MRQVAVPAALGCGCFVGAETSPVFAAEWSLTPVYSASVDYDSNRRLIPDESGSESAVLTADLRFERALEDIQIILEPRYALRRFSNSALGNGDDRSLYAQLDRQWEQATVNLTASYWDQNTLLTELFETGILHGNTHRHLIQAGNNWTWTQAERRQLIAQLSYMDVSYYGQDSALLPGYRYPAASVGERFLFSENWNITLSAFGSMLSSDSRGNSSHEVGGQVELIDSFSERTHLDASIGESARLLAGASSHGTDVAASLTHDLTLGNVAISYTRNLVPYGIGFLVQRQQCMATLMRPLTPSLDGTISALRVDNSQIAVLLGLDRRSYDSLTTGVNWHPAEKWTVGWQVAAVRTQPPQRSSGKLDEWRSLLTLTWNPSPYSRSR